MSYKIEALPPFAKEVKYLAKRYKSLKEDILRLRDELLENLCRERIWRWPP